VLELLMLVLGIPHALDAAALDESLLPVVRVALVFALSAVTGGAWLARALTRSRRSGASKDPQTACHLHDWIRMDDGGFVCLRCSYRAGSSRPAAHDPSI
jgi:hypothetical protein